jgi:hypothetical protein
MLEPEIPIRDWERGRLDLDYLRVTEILKTCSDWLLWFALENKENNYYLFGDIEEND